MTSEHFGGKFALFALVASPLSFHALALSVIMAETVVEAVLLEQYDRLRALIANKDAADVKKLVNEGDEFGDSPLHWAAQKKLILFARFLVVHGANVNAKNNVFTCPLVPCLELRFFHFPSLSLFFSFIFGIISWTPSPSRFDLLALPCLFLCPSLVPLALLLLFSFPCLFLSFIFCISLW